MSFIKVSYPCDRSFKFPRYKFIIANMQIWHTLKSKISSLNLNNIRHQKKRIYYNVCRLSFDFQFVITIRRELNSKLCNFLICKYYFIEVIPKSYWLCNYCVIQIIVIIYGI